MSITLNKDEGKEVCEYECLLSTMALFKFIFYFLQWPYSYSYSVFSSNVSPKTSDIGLNESFPKWVQQFHSSYGNVVLIGFSLFTKTAVISKIKKSIQCNFTFDFDAISECINIMV